MALYFRQQQMLAGVAQYEGDPLGRFITAAGIPQDFQQGRHVERIAGGGCADGGRIGRRLRAAH
ncbi:MAG: hypothetical protein JWL98_14 [Xanthomonadaceae bacterium]|nr:hypothetical protein [Xanthomonadaceae bacterium]